MACMENYVAYTEDSMLKRQHGGNDEGHMLLSSVEQGERGKKSKDPRDFDGGSFLLASAVPVRMRFVGLKY